MIVKKWTSVLILLAVLNITDAQTTESPDYLTWSATRKLKVEDFGLKTQGLIDGLASFAQFTITFKVNGFDFMTKNFNKKVANQVIRSASWIDTAQHTGTSLRYQQTLFDLAEIYTRKFRQDLKANRKSIAGGLDVVNQLNAKAMSDFSKRRLEYASATSGGTNEIAQAEWEQLILQELEEMSAFATTAK